MSRLVLDKRSCFQFRRARQHFQVLDALPKNRHSDPITSAELVTHVDGHSDAYSVGVSLKKLGEFDLVDYTRDSTKFKRCKWFITDEGRRVLREVKAGKEDAPLSCGHTGFVNIGGELKCKVCGELTPVEEARA